MAFFLSCSNRIESLQQQLTDLLRAEPLADPFQKELILVPSAAIKRWLNLQIATQHGIAANIDYPLPASWIWQLAASAHGLEKEASLPQDPLSREQAAWQIFGILPRLLPMPEFAALQHYLKDDASAVKRWQLAQRIADLFDRYQYYRPDWIRAWSQAAAARPMPGVQIPSWQPLLWRALIADCAGQHRVALLDRLLKILESGDNKTIAALQLPDRLCCFALSSLPALFVQVFRALAAHVDLHFFQHSPTDQYWADLQSKRSQAQRRLDNPALHDEGEIGNELLASWGRQGQAFQDQLLNHDLLDAVQWEDYPQPGADSLLHRLQNDMLGLNKAVQSVAIDDSIRVNICHSALRECQVLHDHLLQVMEADKTLSPEDILVIVPEISRYAPSIEAVFRRDGQHKRPFIPWNLSDIAVVDEHPLVRVFFALLALPASRFTFSEVMSILEVPRVADTWGMDIVQLDELHALLQAAQARWGLSAEHKRALDLPATAQNTWAHALDRLLAAYALGDEEMWEGIAPQTGATGTRALALGRFMAFLSVLEYWREELQRPRSVREWQSRLNRMLDQLFGAGMEEEDRVQQIRDVLADLQLLAGEQILTNELLTLWLTDCLGARTVHNRYFSGGVSFCGMRPMRSLPFRMICMLGMNDNAFPRRDTTQSFDAMAAQPRAGDPRKGDEDRYLLLETLLCARQSLYLSYTGRSLADNSECQPSVLLRELMDVLDAHYLPETAAESLVSACITRVQPMQAFSWRHFSANAGGHVTPGYDAWWCQIANALQKRPAALPLQAWPTEQLAPSEEAIVQIELARLVRFLEHPVKAFFNNRLRVYLREDTVPEDEEVFVLDGLQSWKLQKTLAESWMHGDSELESLQASLVAQGVLPHGSQATLAFTNVAGKAESLWSKLAPFRGVETLPTGVDLKLAVPGALLGEIHLHGQIKDYRPGLGLMHFTPSRLKGKSVLRLWVEHLALCATGQLKEGEVSVLHCSDESRTFAAVSASQASTWLADFVAIYLEGMQRPLPLFPSASYRHCSEGASKAEQDWEGGEYPRKGDRDDPYIQLAWRGCLGSPIALEEHVTLSQRVYGAACQAGMVP